MMNLRSCLHGLVVGLVFTVSVQKGHSQVPILVNDTDQAGNIAAALPMVDSLFNAYRNQYHLPGLAYGIVYGGKLIHKGYLGYADPEKKRLVNDASAFRVASMTKSIVAMAILKLRDEGKLRLDDAAEMYIPELKEQKYPYSDAPLISIRHLLTHTAGFPEDNPWGDRQLAISNAEMLTMIKKGVSFSNAPGVAFEYSNMGYAMLGYIIERVTGVSYQQYINQQLFSHLNMSASCWEYDKVPPGNLVYGYRRVGEKWVKQPMLHDGAYGAMGGLITTIDDFSKYVIAHLSAWPSSDDQEAGPIKRSSLREMQQPWAFNNVQSGIVSAYGYGLRWTRDTSARVMVGHSGGLPGFGSNWTILPEYGLAVISFSNQTYAPCGSMNSRVVEAIISRAGLKARKPALSAVLSTRLQQLLKVLPDWKRAEQSGIFAENFFSDNYIEDLRKESARLFKKAGKIRGIKKLEPTNRLRGTFVLDGENAAIEIKFTLSPEHEPLIQQFQIREIKE